jgi:hypothetical protein
MTASLMWLRNVGGTFGTEPGIIKDVEHIKDKDMNVLSEEDKLEAKELNLSVTFIFGADRGQFSSLLDKLQNDYLQGYAYYPKSLQAAYNLLTNWKLNHPRGNGLGSDGVPFATTNVTTNSNKKKTDKRKIVCHKCKKFERYAN